VVPTDGEFLVRVLGFDGSAEDQVSRDGLCRKVPCVGMGGGVGLVAAMFVRFGLFDEEVIVHVGVGQWWGAARPSGV